MRSVTDLGPQCPTCHRHRTLRRVDHPSGTIILCAHCGSIRAKGDRFAADDPAPVLVIVRHDPDVKAAG